MPSNLSGPTKAVCYREVFSAGVSITGDSTVLATYAHVVLELLLPVVVYYGDFNYC